MPEIIRTMWSGLEDLGAGKAKKLRILKPSAGTGRFLGFRLLSAYGVAKGK